VKKDVCEKAKPSKKQSRELVGHTVCRVTKRNLLVELLPLRVVFIVHLIGGLIQVDERPISPFVGKGRTRDA
jgi:hypothetical protein